MKIGSIDFAVGIGASLAVGFAINLVADAGIDHGIATFLVIAAIDAILIAAYKEPLSIKLKSLLFISIGAIIGCVIFIAFYLVSETHIIISAPGGFIDYVIFLITVAILIPLFEEVTVRRLMFIGASYYIGPIFSALFVSALFASTHSGQFLLSFIFSIVLCFMTWIGVSTCNRALLHGSYNGMLSILWIIFGVNVVH